MEITVVVCDHCGARHEIQPDVEPHGHAPFGSGRMPPGWSHLTVSVMPASPAASEDAPYCGDDYEASQAPGFTEATRELVVNQFKYFAETIGNPVVTTEQAKAGLVALMRQLNDSGILDDYGAAPPPPMVHGEHLYARSLAGVYCPSCKPRILHEGSGEPLKCVPQSSYGTIGRGSHGAVVATPVR